MIQQVMNMNIADKFNKGKTVLSFEVFPPKKTSPVETIYGTLEKLVELRPDFISVTYGAGVYNVGACVYIAFVYAGYNFRMGNSQKLRNFSNFQSGLLKHCSHCSVQNYKLFCFKQFFKCHSANPPF